MKKWIYHDDNWFECPVCCYRIQHAKAPKKCPKCEQEMSNSFTRLFWQNNHPQKKIVINDDMTR